MALRPGASLELFQLAMVEVGRENGLFISLLSTKVNCFHLFNSNDLIEGANPSIVLNGTHLYSTEVLNPTMHMYVH